MQRSPMLFTSLYTLDPEADTGRTETVYNRYRAHLQGGTGSSRSAPVNDQFGVEGKRALTPVKDISSSLPGRKDVEVRNRQTLS